MNSAELTEFIGDLAAPGDTWGIPGPTFLRVYVVAAVLAVAAVLVVRSTATRGNAGTQSDNLDPEQIAYLAGGRSQAFFAALAALRTLGLVGSAGPGTIARINVPRFRLSELQGAILQAAGLGARTSRVQSDGRLAGPLDRIQNDLRGRGLLMSPAQSNRCRWAAVALLALAVVGVVRIASALGTGRPFGYLFAVLIVLVVLAMILLAVVPNKTRAGVALLGRLQNANDHLRVSRNPSWATYGAQGAGLSVALFGATALFAMDPVFAGEASIPRYAGGSRGSSDGGSSSSDSGGGSSCSSGGGCGGGGCGG